MRLIGRLFLAVLGLVIAIPFGAVALAIGVALEPAARELAGTLGFATLWSILGDLAAGDMPDERAVALFAAFYTAVFAILVAPPALIAIIGEVLGWRAFLWYAVGTGAVTAALPWAGRARGGLSRSSEAALQAEGRITLILFVTGAVTGCAYWLIAGRSAGRRHIDAGSPRQAPP
jgi:hypothetical protein